MDENKIRKATGKGYLNPAAMSLVFFVVPIASGIGLVLSKMGGHTIAFAVLLVLGSIAALGFLKIVAGNFYSYRKLAYFELGKPIINGLLK